MKVKTLLTALIPPVDIVEIYDDPDRYNLVFKMPFDHFAREYAECRIKKFNLAVVEDCTILEICM